MRRVGSRLRSSRARRGVAVAVGSPSMRRMCRGRGCGAWGHGRGLHARGVVPRSPSMRRVCRAVAGFAPGRLRWRVRRVGSPSLSSRARRGVVAVDAPHVSRSRSSCVSSSRVRRVGSRSWSSRAWRGAAVAVDAARVSRSRALRPVGCGGGCGAWGRRRRLRARGVAVAVFARVGSPSPSSRARRGVVAVDAPRVSRSRSSCVSSSRVRRVGSRSRVAAVTPRASWLSPLRCVWCRCRPFRAAWGVAGAFVASGVVLRRPQEGRRRGGQEGHSDVALTAGKGVMGWRHARVIVVVGNDRVGLLRQFFC